METKTQKLLEIYLDCLGLIDYSVHTTQESENLIFTINVSKKNDAKIGILKGKMGRNIINLRRVLKIVAALEGYFPILIIKLTEEE